MENKIDMTEIVTEVKNASEEELTEVIKDWFEKTRMQGLKLGATYISAAIAGAIRKHLNKEGKVTLRDYKRLVDDIAKIISVPFSKNNKDEKETQEEITKQNETITEATDE